MQIVEGLTPTESGFATLPMVAGLMISSITSGQIVSRTGRYRIFPVTGTAFTAVGFLWLTTMTIDKPLWYMMIGMFVIGLGLGQLMQTLTLASQNSVGTRDMGVATSASTFFRQIGGTLGTAILLSVLFSTMPGNIVAATGNTAILTSALDAALTPSVASAPANRPIMDHLWNAIVDPIKANVQAGLATATTAVESAVKNAVTTQTDAAVKKAVTQKVTAAVDAQVQAGALPASAAPSVIQQQVAAALPAAEQQAQTQASAALPGATSKALAAAASKAHASVVNGRLTVDWSNASERRYYVDKVVPTIVKQITKGNSSTANASTSTTSDTSFLNNADPRLSRPFVTGFNVSAVQIYWVGLIVILIAFVIALFFKVPPLRQRSALQEQADHAAAEDALAVAAGSAAAEAGALEAPTGSVPVGSRS
jgi:hypothetical protein